MCRKLPPAYLRDYDRVRSTHPPQSQSRKADRGRSQFVELIWHAERDVLLRYARGCLRKSQERGICIPADADDLVQEALLTFLQGRLGGYDDCDLVVQRAAVVRSLKTTISNLCRNQVRYERRRVRPNMRQPLTNATDGDKAGYAVLLRHDVSQALQSLPAQRRKAVTGCLILGMPARKVAAVCGTTPKTVRNYLQRAKPQLRASLDKYDRAHLVS